MDQGSERIDEALDRRSRVRSFQSTRFTQVARLLSPFRRFLHLSRVRHVPATTTSLLAGIKQTVVPLFLDGIVPVGQVYSLRERTVQTIDHGQEKFVVVNVVVVIASCDPFVRLFTDRHR